MHYSIPSLVTRACRASPSLVPVPHLSHLQSGCKASSLLHGLLIFTQTRASIGTSVYTEDTTSFSSTEPIRAPGTDRQHRSAPGHQSEASHTHNTESKKILNVGQHFVCFPSVLLIQWIKKKAVIEKLFILQDLKLKFVICNSCSITHIYALQ